MFLLKAFKNKLNLATAFLIFCAAVSAFGGQPQNFSPSSFVNEALKEKLDSKLMKREMNYRVILPKDYAGAKEKRYPTIFLLHGLFGNQDNWSTLTKLTTYAEKYEIIIVMPHGANGWYTDNVSKPEDKYESYIIKELIPEVDKKFRTKNERKSRAIAGLSMGGYGAMKFALKYPQMFAVAGSFSGALGAATLDEKTAGANIAVTLNAIFGEPNSETRKANDIFGFVRNATQDQIKELPFLYIDCGTEDFLFQNNRDFIDLLVEKKITHEYRQLPGAHNWPYWDKQVQEFLRFADKTFAEK